ncbi:MAG TPA: DUF222 domain-containing protein [Gaiellaceae bacterium]|nr:DUF222 domain-containing protein [Gaiellaceae bacterium]
MPARVQRQERLEAQLATLCAHLNAGMARLLELVSEFEEEGGAPFDDLARWLAFRCGVSPREAREYVRVARALRELPATRAAFGRGELTFTKVRALTRVATPASEQGLLDLAAVLTASQLERALRAFRRLRKEDAAEAHALEYVDYYWDEDGSLCLRARLPAEEGTLVVRALEAARDRIWERRREEQQALEAQVDERDAGRAREFEPPRPVDVEALVEVALASLAPVEPSQERPRLVVHVDAAALAADGAGRSELEDGPLISPETARRLGCEAERVTVLERDGLPLSVGRKRRTVPPRLRRLLEARDDHTCRWPGCERRRHLDAHHRRHWAQGGETSLDNLVLLCWHHHRLVHEGGYTIEDGQDGELRFRNRHGLLVPSVPRSPPGSIDALLAQNEQAGIRAGPHTNRNGDGDRAELHLVVAAIEHAFARGRPSEARAPSEAVGVG